MMMVYNRFYWMLWMLSCFEQYFGEDLQFSEPANGAVGGSVVFTPDNLPSTSIDIIQWHFGTNIILSAQSDSAIIASAYRDRVSFDRNTLALELRNLRLNDSGKYRLTVITTAGETLTGETSLQVLAEDLQFSDPANGAVGGSVVFTPDNLPSTSIDAIQWHFGTNIILTAQSDSTIIVSAYRDRVSFDRNTLALELRNLRLDDSGKYSLTVIPTAGHQLTGETSLQVFENITNVRFTGPEESLIEGESSANISSEGTGSISSVQWMKDNSPLSPSNRISFSSDNRSVSISPVQRSDSGEYQCTYRNPVSSETTKLSLIINYGPEDVSIKGQDVVDLGVRVSLSCSANSEPSASFSWKFNETDTDVTTDTFTIDQTDFTHSGDYECTALNNVTKRNATQKHALLVKGKKS
ncbi:carcinoembryonic antigen-related cell adhesion molecule 1-like isoform X2 [Onychostoma macrolepis]|uniref:carcinoembryonic antigen-related cell adhesion molecule 1-like isoform X2 n=1 Tax=Onychostoma macrolepis TaxID=369639 RepID=UPI00272C7A43|nr:carcinoembryonic antigen-related cell adhesion molecule 1-like isoform X2 [Onychostoma macrolepis]